MNRKRQEKRRLDEQYNPQESDRKPQKDCLPLNLEGINYKGVTRKQLARRLGLVKKGKVRDEWIEEWNEARKNSTEIISHDYAKALAEFAFWEKVGNRWMRTRNP